VHFGTIDELERLVGGGKIGANNGQFVHVLREVKLQPKNERARTVWFGYYCVLKEHSVIVSDQDRTLFLHTICEGKI